MGKLAQKNETFDVIKKQIERQLDEGDSDRDDVKEQVIAQGKDLKILWKANDLQMQIWDDGEFDEDRISIILNGQIMESTVLLTALPKVFNYRLQKGKNILTIKALNHGRVPPNSAKAILSNQMGEKQVIRNYNNSGEASKIYIQCD